MAATVRKFVWYDVMTTDTQAAENFYRRRDRNGTSKDSGMPDQFYKLLLVGETMVGGIDADPEDACKAGVGPAWMGYIGVDDVDAYADRVAEGGR